jgi:enterobactin synthetase component D
VYCDFRLEKFHPSLFAYFDIEFPVEMERSVVKRRAEFLAGRLAAARALEALGCTDCAVPIGENRSPQWPEGISASISHSDGRALCVASRKSRNEYLGVDLEKLVSAEVAGNIGDSIASETELNLLMRSGLPKNTAITLAFSAKESLYKALYPSIGEYFGFERARVATFYPGEQCVTLQLDKDLARHCRGKATYQCDFVWSGDMLQTLVAGQFPESGGSI